MFKKIVKYYQTLRHLKWIQLRYQLYYRLSKAQLPPAPPSLNSQQLQLAPSIQSYQSYQQNRRFSFLNLDHQFADPIDWNYAQYGKLWTYNLNYFEFLLQKNIDPAEGLALIHDFIRHEAQLKDGLEPFPISLRSLFWIRFLVEHQIEDSTIDSFLYRQLQLLHQRPEYHLLGNHLLENAFALLFGAYYFNDPTFYKLASQLLRSELEEQILPDGAHFELSPMYHSLMFYRLLDCINLVDNNPHLFASELSTFLHNKASLMLNWLHQLRFSNGELPQLNDSAEQIAPAAAQLIAYAERLGIKAQEEPLGDSGYRKYRKGQYEVLVDIGKIGPDYIPGHAHSDSLNFVLHYRGKALIVDSGTSTYEKNGRRRLERSTASHNTVEVGGEEQSEVWGGFRVARRARIVELEETPERITAAHDGYQHLRCIHQRQFLFEDKNIEIIDKVTGDQNACAYLHFHPMTKPRIVQEEVVGDFGKIQFSKGARLTLQSYSFAKGFNHTTEAVMAVINFKDKLHTKILLT